MSALSKYPRWAVMQALCRVREMVAHGAPSLATALHYARPRLSQRAWSETTKALDAVFFDMAEVPSGEPTKPASGEPPHAAELRELLIAAKDNVHLPWESPEGLTRGELVSILTLAVESVRRMPSNGHGPLFPAPLPIIDRSESHE